jgi:hypothetical protein
MSYEISDKATRNAIPTSALRRKLHELFDAGTSISVAHITPR